MNKMERGNLTPGFTMSMRTRPLVIAKMMDYVRERSVTIKSQRLLKEMRVFVWKNGKAQAQTNYNDDLVMAFATGLYVRDTALRLRQQGMDLSRANLSAINSLNNRQVAAYSVGSLQRLFSTDVVIRNVGRTQLKVADVNHIQSTGRYETNSLVDRFSRLYLYNNKNIFNPNLNYQTLRIQLYSDYEAMDTDPLIASTLDIIADEATVKNDQGEILQIQSSDENIQRVLYNLFYDFLNREFNLWSWKRQMCKY